MVNTSIDVPRHLLLTDDGKEPDDWAEARAAAIRNARERYRDLGYSDLKERKRGLDERITERKTTLERLENAVAFFELAFRIAAKRANRHGMESRVVEALSPANADDGWTLELAAGWGDEEPEHCGAEWKPSPELLASEGVDPDSTHVPRSLSYGPDATWKDVLRDLDESVQLEQRSDVRRDLDELEFRRSVLDSVMEEKERGMDRRVPSDESDDFENEYSPTRETKRRSIIAHRIDQNGRTSVNDRSDLNRLLREFIEWDSGDPPTRPLDAVYEAIEYAPGRGKGDIEEALELLHVRVEEFEEDLGDKVVENLERIVDRWAEDRSENE